MRKTVIAAAVTIAILVGCVPPKPPVTPKPQPPSPTKPVVSIDFTVSCKGKRVVTVVDYFGRKQATTLPDGWTRFDNIDASDHGMTGVAIAATGDCRGVTAAVQLDGKPHNPPNDFHFDLPPNFFSAGESGPIHVDGLAFRRADGSVFQYRGATDFQLYLRYLRGEDIGPVLDQRANPCGPDGVCPGANVERVLGSFDWSMFADPTAKLIVQSEGQYYARLSSFLSLLKDHGFRVEFTAWGDGGQLTTRDSQVAHIQKLGDIFAQAPNVFLEVANEPMGDKNIVGGGDRAQELGQLVRGRGFLVANGDYDLPVDATSFHMLDYVTVHTSRDGEWMRKAKDISEWRDGIGWASGLSFPGARRPVIGDEPMGFDETAHGSRVTDVDDAAYYGGNCALFGAGCTYHSEAGTSSTLWGPIQRAAAKAFYGAMAWVPTSAQFAGYQRGAGDDGPGIGDMPMVAWDLNDRPDGAIRTYCKATEGFEWCVATRPGSQWKAIGRRGCTVVEQPAHLPRGFVKLRCQ